MPAPAAVRDGSSTSSSTALLLAAGGGAGGGGDGRVRAALTAAYAVGGMALALFSSLDGGSGAVAAAQQQQEAEAGARGAKKKREPRMVTGAEAGADNKEFYPQIEPFRTGMLQVSPLHTLYWEESGNPKGKPVVFLHGGPGGGTAPDFRRYFDPAVYRVVVFDQRGCGKSTPHACLDENTCVRACSACCAGSCYCAVWMCVVWWVWTRFHLIDGTPRGGKKKKSGLPHTHTTNHPKTIHQSGRGTWWTTSSASACTSASTAGRSSAAAGGARSASRMPSRWVNRWVGG